MYILKLRAPARGKGWKNQGGPYNELATSRTRGHPFKLYKRFCSSSARSLFFSERLINCWNQLPNSIVFCSLYKFKNSLDTIDCSLLTG